MEFLDRLVSIALPRIRDFRGLSPKQFDRHGNYTFGLAEQSVFHEIDVDSIDRPRGHGHHRRHLGDERRRGRALLQALGFPFRRTEQMAKKALVNKANKKPKFAVRAYTRCNRCGRPHGVPQVRPVPDLPAGDGTRR